MEATLECGEFKLWYYKSQVNGLQQFLDPLGVSMVKCTQKMVQKLEL